MLSIHLFGTLSLMHGANCVENLRLGKPAELFCFLLLRRERPHPREVLASMLWGDYTTEVSKKYLRQALWQLQLIVRNCVEGASVLVADRDCVHVSLAEGLSLDVDQFEKACGPLLRVPSSQLNEGHAKLLREAVDLYRGDLLEGWYQEWCLIERERLQNMYLIILQKLMHYSEEHQRWDEGIEIAERILRLDRAHEGAHRSLMRLLFSSGDRAGAIRQYVRCETALLEDLGVGPAPRTTELLEQIRAGDTRKSMPAPSLPRAPHNADPEREENNSMSKVLPHLRRVIGILSETQSRLQNEIEAIDAGLPRNPPKQVPDSPKLRVNQR